MCEFISWIEYKKEILFLTKYELETVQGKKLRKYLGTQYENDIKGHGAIEWYYKLKPNSGRHKECTDFSLPDNFPKPIAAAIKKGLFCGIGIAEQLLTKPAWAEYEKIALAALAEYKKIALAALAEYKKIALAALAEYEKIAQAAWAEYEKIAQPAFWKIFKTKKNRIKAWQ